MSSIVKIIAVNNRPIYQAVVNVDADVDTSRVLIIDRLSGVAYQNYKLKNNKVLGFIVPSHHAASNTLLVGILDDTGNFDASFVDGVKAELIDGHVVNIRP